MNPTAEIAALKQQISQLEQQTQALRDLEHGLQDFAIYKLDTAGTICSWNEGALKLTGFSAAEMIGQPMARLYPPLEAEQAADDLQQAREAGRSQHVGWFVQQKGTRFWGQAKLTALYSNAAADAAADNEERNLSGFIGIMEEVTPQHKLAHMLGQRQEKYVEALHKTTLGLIGRLDLDELLADIINWAASLVGTEHGFIYLTEPGEADFILRVGVGLFEPYVGQRISLLKGLPGLVYQQGKMHYVPDYQQLPQVDERFKSLPMHATIAVPLREEEGVVGVLCLVHATPSLAFAEAEMEVLAQFADLASIAIDNVRLHETAKAELTVREQVVEILRESEQRFRTLISNLPTVIYRTLFDDQWTFAYLSESIEKLAGYPASYFTNKGLHTYLDLVHPDDISLVEQAFAEVRETWQPFEIEYRLQHASGNIHWVSAKGQVTLDQEHKKPLFVDGILFDITERKESNDRLRLMDAAVQYSTESVLITEANLEKPGPKIVFVNPSFTKMSGYSVEEIIGKTPRLLQGPKTDGKMLKNLKETLRRGEPFYAETTNYRKNGSEYIVEWRIAPIRDDKGKITHWVSVQHDNTARKKAEESLARLASILEATTDFVSTADREGNILYLNKAGRKMVGLPEDTAALTISDFHTPEMARYLQEEAIPLALEQGTWSGETQLWHQEGYEIPVSQVVIVHHSDQEAAFISTVARDISELKQIEQDLRVAKQAAEAANRAKSVFLARMSHELRTPLNAILGFVQLMMNDDSLETRQRENLGIIGRSGEHLLGLINDVLEISKIEAGQTTLNKTNFDLLDLLRSIKDMFGVRTDQNELWFETDFAADLPQYVQGDESKFRQVLINLLGNAVKFTKSGRITLHVAPANLSESEKTVWQPDFAVLCKVVDTGPGIPEEEAAAIFEPFAQTEVGRMSQEGTGLGLPISREFVRLMGGELEMQTVLGEGTTFYFEVPLPPVTSEEVEQRTQQPRVLGLQPGQPDYRILVVDDKWENRNVLVKMLGLLGFSVREAANGKDAISIWRQWQPHLIWMDMRMPEMDGYEATLYIRRHAHEHPTIIIALTASAFDYERERMLQVGCDDILAKPFRQEDIFQKMHKYLGVEFIYEELPSAEEGEAALPEPAKTGHISETTAAWRAKLTEAAQQLNTQATKILIAEIAAEHPELAKKLTELVRAYRFDKVLMLMEQIDQDE